MDLPTCSTFCCALLPRLASSLLSIDKDEANNDSDILPVTTISRSARFSIDDYIWLGKSYYQAY